MTNYTLSLPQELRASYSEGMLVQIQNTCEAAARHCFHHAGSYGRVEEVKDIQGKDEDKRSAEKC